MYTRVAGCMLATSSGETVGRGGIKRGSNNVSYARQAGGHTAQYDRWLHGFLNASLIVSSPLTRGALR